MKKILYYTVTTIIIVLKHAVLTAMPIVPIIFTDSSKLQLIGDHVYILEDKTNNINLSEAIKSNEYVENIKKVPNLGVTTSTFWIKLSIHNSSSLTNLLLEVAQPTLSDIVFFDGKNIIEEGTGKFFINRYLNSQTFLFKLSINKGETRTFYLKVKSLDQVMLPLYLGLPEKIIESLTKKDLLFGIFFGIISVMFLYNSFIYFSVRDTLYLYYVLYILFIALVQSSLQGYGFKFLWPHSLWLAKNSIFIFPAIANSSAMIFAMLFLNIKVNTPQYYKLLLFLLIIFLSTIVLALIGKYKESFIIMQADTVITSIFLLFVSFNILKQGYRPAKFFIISWSFLLIGAIIFVLKDFGILPYNLFTSYSLQIGSALEVILLSFALADKINIYKKEKEISQAATLSVLQENEKIIREQNSTLERKVKERTNELVATNKNLSKTLTDLKEAQTQLVEAEKMASLGQLTAGIAHEINNPINFVTSNVGPLKRDVDILVDAIVNIESLGLSDVSIDEKQQQIDDYKEEIDLDYLKLEISQLINGIHEGATRTADIVKGLKIFSRLDEDDLKKADINEGINSTLTIANNLIGNKIQIIRNMDDLPLIECYPGKLNQVFLNIISNAVFAIQEKFNNQTGGILKISTSYDETYLTIKVEDNGTGMSEATKQKIFEPFFTTKNVGVGTGLGMSIVYNTIKKHNAKIYLNSTEGVGTEFVIQLNLVFTEPIADYQSEQQG